MALTDEVTDRYSSQYLIGLTNPQLSSAAAIDTTRLARAATDVEADFEIYPGIAFVTTNSLHVSTAVEGVILKLMMRTGQFDAEALQTRYIALLTALGRVTGRNRLLTSTDSQLQPSRDQVDGEIVRPDFDVRRFVDFIPNPPQTGDLLNRD